MKVKINGLSIEEANGYCWAFGKFVPMKKVARALRQDAGLRESFAEYGVRLGRRNGDAPPRSPEDPQEAVEFYRGRLLSPHYLIEPGIIERLGVRDAKLQPDQLTCVLVTAELQRRWYTAGVAAARHDFQLGMPREEAAYQLRKTYDRLYEGSAMSQLRLRVGKLIEKIGRSL